METGTAEKNKEEKTEIPEKKEEAGKKKPGGKRMELLRQLHKELWMFSLCHANGGCWGFLFCLRQQPCFAGDKMEQCDNDVSDSADCMCASVYCVAAFAAL